MLVLSQEHIRRGLSYERASQLIRRGFEQLVDEQIESPARHVFRSKGTGPVLGFMPALSSNHLSAKVAAVQYSNPQSGLDSHQGAVLVFSRTNGVLQAVLDATELTAIRTTAVSHLAMSYYLDTLAGDTPKIAIVGSGVQAFHHIKMASSCFGVKQFVVMSKSSERVRELHEALGPDISIEHRPYGAVLSDCKIIVTATHGSEVVLTRSQIGSGSLILAIGACQPRTQEIAHDVLKDCQFVIDHVGSLLGCGEGLSRLETHPEGPALPCESASFQNTDGRITVFKAVGLGFEDLVCAEYLVETLGEQGGGLRIDDFGGRRGY